MFTSEHWPRLQRYQSSVWCLKLGVDWVALSFVQKPEDVIEARKIIGDKAHICIKMEKPSALEHLDELVALADGMMVARGGFRRRTAP